MFRFSHVPYRIYRRMFYCAQQCSIFPCFAISTITHIPLGPDGVLMCMYSIGYVATFHKVQAVLGVDANADLLHVALFLYLQELPKTRYS